MTDKNHEYLVNQLKQTGFDDLQQQLKEQMQKQVPHFVLILDSKIGKDQLTASLQFKKSDNNMYYIFEKYSLSLKNQQYQGGIKQTFTVNPGKDNITLGEALNMMNGRAVHKELTNKQGEKYNVWLQLDFKETNKQCDFKMK